MGNYANTITTSANIDLANSSINLGNSSTLQFGTDGITQGQLTFNAGGNSEFITEQDLDTAKYSVYRDGANGTNIDFFKAGGSIASPSAIGANDYVYREEFYAQDDTGSFYSVPGASYSVYQDANTGSVSTDDIPLAHEFAVQRTPDTGFAQSVLKLTADRRIIFNDTGVKGFGSYTGTANISADGKLHTAGNITSDGYFLGDGSLLQNLPTGGDAFGTITVAGQTNIQATQSNAILDIASSGDITLTTSGNTLTIGGSGGTYGNSEVEAFLGSDTMTGDIIYTGNLELSSANVTTAITEYQGNVTTGNGDRIIVASDPGWFSGQFVTFSGTTNANLTFLNGNVYQVQRISGTAYDVYTNYKTFTRLVTEIGTETNTNGLETDTRTSDNTSATVYGNLYVTANNTLHTNDIAPFTTGGTFSMTGIRASDVGLGQNGDDFFWPETGGSTRGGLLVANPTGDGVGSWKQGYETAVTTASPITSNVTMVVDSSTGIHEIHKKARGTEGSESILSNNDRLHEVEYHGHDGVAYQNTFMEHTYVDGDAALSVGANVVPLTKEFMTYTGGDVNAGFMQSIVKFTPDRTIIFNDTGTRSFGNYQGNANITQDGSINSVSTITGLNIKSDQFLQLKNYSNTEILALSGMAAGDVVFNSTDNTIAFYEGSNWKNLTVTGNVT